MIKRIRVQPAWLLIIYPTWFMWPTLSFHSSNLIKPSTYSDLNGLYNSALFLHGMKFPWSKVANLNGMVGESFWSLATYSQSIHYVLIWLLTRLLPYVIAANLYLLLSWILSGVMAYAVSREIGSSKFASFFVGLILQLSPFLREKLFNHFVYGNLIYILLVILFCIRYSKKPSLSGLVWLIALVVSGCVFDLYWFYFGSLFLFLFLGFLILEHRNLIYSGIFILSVVMLLLVEAFLFRSISRSMLLNDPLNRTLQIAPTAWINETNHGTFLQFILGNRDGYIAEYGYLGITTCVLLLIGILRGSQTTTRWLINRLALIAVAFALLTLPTSVSIGNLEFLTPINVVRYLMPGVRFFERSGFVMVIICCMLCGVGVTRLMQGTQKFAIMWGLALLIIGGVFLDLSPVRSRTFDPGLQCFKEVQNVLDETGNTGILNLPVTQLDGQIFAPYPQIPFYYLNTRSLFSFKNSTWVENLVLYSARGEDEFVSYLLANGITHIAIRTGDLKLLNGEHNWKAPNNVLYNLSSDRYSLIAETGCGVPTSVYRINENPDTGYCKGCFPFRTKWDGVGNQFGKFWIDGNIVTTIDGDISWVKFGELPQFRVQSDSAKAKFRVTFSFVPYYGAGAKSNVLTVRSHGMNYPVVLNAGKISSISLMVERGETVFVTTSFGCPSGMDIEIVNLDPQRVCFGVQDVRVSELASS